MVKAALEAVAEKDGLPSLNERQLADAVKTYESSGDELAALERDNLFLFPLNGEHDEYRYHSLFASYLQHRLHAIDPARETQLHAAAAHWYLDAGRPVPAIDHLLARIGRDLLRLGL